MDRIQLAQNDEFLTRQSRQEILASGYYYYFYGAGAERNPLLLQQFIGLSYKTWLINDDVSGTINGMNWWQWKPKYSEKTCPTAVLSTTEPT
jgi:hypothetical protein